jgi:cell wall-associated NlpC family hydrolase
VGFSRIVRSTTLATSAVLAAALMVTAGYAEPPPSADLDRQIATAWQQLEVVIEQYDAIRDESRATSAQMTAVSAELVPLRAAVTDAQERVSEIANSMYRDGRMGGLSAMLTAGSPGTLMDQLAMLDHVARARQRDFTRLDAARVAYEQQRRSLNALSVRQQSQQADLATRKAGIEAEIRRLQGLRSRAFRGASEVRMARGALRDGYVPAVGSDPAGRAVKFAYSQLGKVYRFAAEGPDAYDCSGLTMAAWRSVGVTLPHNAARQYRSVKRIERAELRPGDLVFYYRDIHHVAMYIGAGRVIEAPQAGERISMRPVDFAPVSGYGRVT